MHCLYLLVNLFTILVPLIFSFHPRIKFYRYWNAFFPANLLSAVIFIIWDIGFTRAGVWSFNPGYVTGIYFFNLPVEEILFFICIPFSCVFTWFCLEKFYRLSWISKYEKIVFLILPLSMLATGFIYLGHLYTSVTFISTAVFILLLKFVCRVNWLGKFLVVYIVLLMPFTIVNGILTGTGIPEAVVQYNEAQITRLRLLTIPVEDIFYGMELVLLNLVFFKLFLHTKESK